MIKIVGQVMSTAIEAGKPRESGGTKAATPAGRATAPAIAETLSTPAARMAAQGAPIDSARIQRVKDAIASGNYPVDPDKIAEQMLDFIPSKS